MSTLLISDLIQQLQRACESNDWEQLKELDQNIRSAVDSLLSAESASKDKEDVISILKKIQRIYQMVIEDSVKNQTEISKELRKLTKDQQASSSYLNISQF